MYFEVKCARTWIIHFKTQVYTADVQFNDLPPFVGVGAGIAHWLVEDTDAVAVASVVALGEGVEERLVSQRIPLYWARHMHTPLLQVPLFWQVYGPGKGMYSSFQ